MVCLMNQRCMYNLFKHLQGSFFVKIVKDYKPLFLPNKLTADVRIGSTHGSVNITLHLTFFKRT